MSPSTWGYKFKPKAGYTGPVCCKECSQSRCPNPCPRSGEDCTHCSWLVDTPCDPSNKRERRERPIPDFDMGDRLP